MRDFSRSARLFKAVSFVIIGAMLLSEFLGERFSLIGIVIPVGSCLVAIYFAKFSDRKEEGVSVLAGLIFLLAFAYIYLLGDTPRD